MRRLIYSCMHFVFLPGLPLISALLVGCGPNTNDSAEPASAPPMNKPKAADTRREEPPYDGRYGGLFPADSPEIPETIREIGASVFRLLIPMESQAEKIDLSFFKASEYLKAVQERRASEIWKTAVRRQIEACLERMGFWPRVGVGSAECRVSEVFAIGTGFVTGDGSTLWSSFQTAKRGLGLLENIQAASAGTESATPWPVFVFDQKGQLVFDSLKEAFKPARFPAQAGKKYFTFLSVPNEDYISWQLPRALGRPLAIASSSPRNKERIFLAGYPECTGCTDKPEDLRASDRSPYPNSDGQSLRFAIGTMAEKEDFTTLRPLNIAEAYEFNDFPLQWADLDGQIGCSGAPVLNEKGEVLGMVTLTDARLENEKIRRRTVFLRPMTTPFEDLAF